MDAAQKPEGQHQEEVDLRMQIFMKVHLTLFLQYKD